MATTFYPNNSASAATSSTWTNGPTVKELLLTRGGGVVSDSQPTISTLSTSVAALSSIHAWGITTAQGLVSGNGRNWTASSIIFATNPLNAFTLAGQITINARGLETNAMANYGLGCEILKVASGGGLQTHIAYAANATELGTSELDRSMTVTPSSTAISDGDRLILAIFYYAAGGTSASGYTATSYWNGTSGGASGDTYITFTETVTEQAGAPIEIPTTYVVRERT